MVTQDDLARAICCPGGTCIRPEACDRASRNVVVNVPLAAKAVHELLCRRWREWPRNIGPMSVTVTYGGGDDT